MPSPEKVQLWQPLRAVDIVTHGDPRPDTAEMERLQQEAYERGFKDASVNVSQQILDQRQELSEVCDTLFKSMETGVVDAVRDIRSALPGLTMQALKRVLSRVTIDRDVIVGVVEELLTEIGPDVGPIEVRLHPQDLEFIQELDSQLARNHPGLRLVADEALARGDCQAMTRFGKVDGRLENKLEQLEASSARA